ncbi:MAG: hypothetical protein AB7I30_08820 [Isosphaeraceae bacterium]
MTPALAQTLRRSGLLLELLAMAGMVWRTRGDAPFWESLPFSPATGLAALFATGFGLWLTGTLALLAARNRRER